MEVQEEAEEYIAYKILWEEKVPRLITILENIEESELSMPLLKLQSTYAPILRKIDIIVFEKGEIVVWRSDASFMENKPEVTLRAQLSKELLDEIKRLLDQKNLKKQKSCFRVVRDGYKSTLTLHVKDKLKVIYNENCKMSEFSLSYRKLTLLLHLILYMIEK